jgi:hypothetical protein
MVVFKVLHKLRGSPFLLISMIFEMLKTVT